MPVLDRCIDGMKQVQKIEKIAPVLKVVALCVPPVMMSLIGLAALSRRKGGSGIAAAKPPPSASATVRRGGSG